MKGIQYPKIISYKPSCSKGVFILLLSCFSIGLFAIPVPADALWGIDVAGPLKTALLYFGAAVFGLVFWIFNWIGILVLSIASLVLQAMMSFILEVGYTPYTDLSVLVGWRVIRDIAHMVLIFALLAIGISTILGIRLNDRDDSVGKQLIVFVAVAILIQFTPLITGVVIDISNIFTKVFFDQAQSAVGGFSDHHPFASSWNDYQSFGDAEEAAAYSLGLIISVFYSFAATVVLFTASFLLVARVIAIQLLVIFSPLAFVAQLVPKGKKRFDQWLEQFLQWCFLPVGLGLFLWLSAVILANGMTACTNPDGYKTQFLTEKGIEKAKHSNIDINNGFQTTNNLGVTSTDIDNPRAQTAINSTIGGENMCKATVSIMALATIVAGIFVSASTSAYGAKTITQKAKLAFESGSKKIARYGIRGAGVVAAAPFGGAAAGAALAGGRMSQSTRLMNTFKHFGANSQYGTGTKDGKRGKALGAAMRFTGAKTRGTGSVMVGATRDVGAGLKYAAKVTGQAVEDQSSLKNLPAEVLQDSIRSAPKDSTKAKVFRGVGGVLRGVGATDTANTLSGHLLHQYNINPVPRESLETLTDRVHTAKTRDEQTTHLITIAKQYSMDAATTVVDQLDKDAKEYFQGDAQKLDKLVGGGGKNGTKGGFRTGDFFKAINGDINARKEVETTIISNNLQRFQRKKVGELEKFLDLENASETEFLASITELYKQGEHDTVNNTIRNMTDEQKQQVQKVAATIDRTSINKSINDTNDENAFTIKESADSLFDPKIQTDIIGKSARQRHITTRKQFVDTNSNRLKDKDGMAQMINSPYTNDRTRNMLIATVASTEDGDKTLREMVQDKTIDQKHIDTAAKDNALQHILIDDGATVKPARSVIDRVRGDIKEDEHTWNPLNLPSPSVLKDHKLQTELYADNRHAARQARRQATIGKNNLRKLNDETRKIIEQQDAIIKQIDDEAGGKSLTPEQQRNRDNAENIRTAARLKVSQQTNTQRKVQEKASDTRKQAHRTRTTKNTLESRYP